MLQLRQLGQSILLFILLFHSLAFSEEHNLHDIAQYGVFPFDEEKVQKELAPFLGLNKEKLLERIGDEGIKIFIWPERNFSAVYKLSAKFAYRAIKTGVPIDLEDPYSWPAELINSKEGAIFYYSYYPEAGISFFSQVEGCFIGATDGECFEPYSRSDKLVIRPDATKLTLLHEFIHFIRYKEIKNRIQKSSKFLINGSDQIMKQYLELNLAKNREDFNARIKKLVLGTLLELEKVENKEQINFYVEEILTCAFIIKNYDKLNSDELGGRSAHSRYFKELLDEWRESLTNPSRTADIFLYIEESLNLEKFPESLAHMNTFREDASKEKEAQLEIIKQLEKIYEEQYKKYDSVN